MKQTLLIVSLAAAGLLGSASAIASEEVSTWTCSESKQFKTSCLLYTSPSPRDLSTSRMPSSA